MNMCDKCELNLICFEEKLNKTHCSNYEPTKSSNYKLNSKTIISMQLEMTPYLKILGSPISTSGPFYNYSPRTASFSVYLHIKRNKDKYAKKFEFDDVFYINFNINEITDELNIKYSEFPNINPNSLLKKSIFDIDKSDKTFIEFLNIINYEWNNYAEIKSFQASYIYPEIFDIIYLKNDGYHRIDKN